MYYFWFEAKLGFLQSLTQYDSGASRLGLFNLSSTESNRFTVDVTSRGGPGLMCGVNSQDQDKSETSWAQNQVKPKTSAWYTRKTSENWNSAKSSLTSNDKLMWGFNLVKV